jgi:2-dehydro-3-deoxy-D-gluconate 5-dehydrogenase
MTSPFDLTGRIAVVTGANSGIGQGIAVALARAGADIVAVGRSAPDETREAVQAAGRRLHVVQADMSSSADVARVIDEAVAQAGAVDILVNNAGMIRRAEALELTEDDWDSVLDVNLKSVFFLSQAAARWMLGRGRGGKIINIASLLSFQGGIRVASYTASKSGLGGITKILANEWAPKGINVNAIAPGYIATKNTRALQQDESRNREITARIPAGRWGRPDDIGGAAVFLASEAARYVHGIILPVDGGWLAR